jgi:hypothetical protein
MYEAILGTPMRTKLFSLDFYGRSLLFSRIFENLYSYQISKFQNIVYDVIKRT